MALTITTRLLVGGSSKKTGEVSNTSTGIHQENGSHKENGIYLSTNQQEGMIPSSDNTEISISASSNGPVVHYHPPASQIVAGDLDNGQANVNHEEVENIKNLNHSEVTAASHSEVTGANLVYGADLAPEAEGTENPYESLAERLPEPKTPYQEMF